jgi:hypothetical protein
MGQTTRLSANMINRMTSASGKQNQTITWHSTNLTVRHFLPIEEYVDCVRGIVDDCKAPDGSIAIELLDFSERLHIITAYAYVDMPEDFKQLYYIVYNSDLYDTVIKYVNDAQINAIHNTVALMLTEACKLCQ